MSYLYLSLTFMYGYLFGFWTLLILLRIDDDND